MDKGRGLFLDPDLFGNDAGEDESIEKLTDYFLIKPVHEKFFNKSSSLCFVRARKGVGKSALLCYTASKALKDYPKDIVINIKASDLMPSSPNDSRNAMEYTNWWQTQICTRINNEIGKRISAAFSDDAMSIVELAELSGFKGKNLIGSLLERIKVKTEKGEISLSADVKQNSFELLKRFQEEHTDKTVWLLIDDIDATFRDTESNRLFISTFFSACRLLANSIKGLNIRASVRTDVWTLISKDEALDKCEQYMLDLMWSTSDSINILNKKIEIYLKNHPEETKDTCEVFESVFTHRFRWGNWKVHPFRVIHILSAGRPRWASQLCRIAARDAYDKKQEYISMSNISFAMEEYGRMRLSDLQKEHGHQCNKISEIIESFRSGSREYRYPLLIEHIKDNIISKVDNIIIDENQTSDPTTIAKFIYRIGFLTLRNNEYNTAAGFTRFEESPNLLGPTNVKEDDLWIIHPAYRTALNIK